MTTATPTADPQSRLEDAVTAALHAAFGDAAADADPLVRPANDPKFGDFQCNAAMGLAKRLGTPPRDVAGAIVEHLGSPDWITDAAIAGPGFINFTLDAAALDAAAAALADDPRLGVPRAQPARTVTVDYAGPNLAKEMHVGHLRSTVIGDAICRVLDAAGHRVIRQNHIGDWGTQFGMLLEHLIETGWVQAANQHIGDLNTLYQEAKKRFDDDADFQGRARKRVVALQAGDDASLTIWRQLIGESVRHMNDVFGRLGVTLTDDDLKPESFYNPRLADTCDALESAGVARESEGALCVFVEGEEAPLIIRKSDGGYGYATTDLAAIRYRVAELGADRLVYVVDSRQRDHFNKVFAGARGAGWAVDGADLDYVPFGTVLGPDKRPFKTRSGDTVKLTDLLDEAVERAANAIAEKNPDLPPDEKAAVADAVGIGAIKYGDLSNDRIKDYVFDWDRMLALEGNTAPYLQYSVARIHSIFRKGGIDADAARGGRVAVTEPAERQLVLHLLRFGSAVASVESSLEPHRLCTYLYELATLYHRFYEHCPVLKDGIEPAVRESRLALCALVAAVLDRGLGMLGIRTVERM